jgi:hypothetical protein
MVMLSPVASDATELEDRKAMRSVTRGPQQHYLDAPPHHQREIYAGDQRAHLLEGIGNAVKDNEHRPPDLNQKGQIGEGSEQMGQIGDAACQPDERSCVRVVCSQKSSQLTWHALSPQQPQHWVVTNRARYLLERQRAVSRKPLVA